MHHFTMIILNFLFVALISKFVDGGGVDEVIAAAPESSDAFELLQGNDTVLVELDMRIPMEEYVFMQKYGRADQETKPVDKRDLDLVNRYRRKGAGNKNKRWPDKTVPYEITGCYSEKEKELIYESMADFHRYTCTRWRVAQPMEKVKVFFSESEGGCSAFPGCYHQSQGIFLDKFCRKKGTIIHEMAHTLGFYHEQSRPDRDNYVTLHKENMIFGMDSQFQKYNRQVIPDWGVDYDYESIMHYGEKAFSANRKRTITAKDARFQDKMGNRDGFTFRDLKTLNIMYQCNEHCKNPPKCPGEGFVGRDCKCWCKGPDFKNPIKYCNGRGKPRDPGPKVERDPLAPKNCVATNKISKPRRCTDKASNCDTMKSYCTQSRWESFVKTNCRVTCGFDKVPAACNVKYSPGQFPDCVDGNDKCRQFAEQGECETNLIYMTSMCPRSCGLCRRQYRVQHSECKDTNKHCAAAAGQGACDFNKTYMRAECKKSCGLCF